MNAESMLIVPVKKCHIFYDFIFKNFSKIGKSTEMQSCCPWLGDLGGNGELLLMGMAFFFFNLEGCKCSKTDCGDGCTKL